LIVNVDAVPGQIELVVYGFPVMAAQVNGRPRPVAQREDDASVLRFASEETNVARLHHA
jgi:hypothetical protein